MGKSEEVLFIQYAYDAGGKDSLLLRTQLVKLGSKSSW